MLSNGTVSDQENLCEVHNVLLGTVISSLETRLSEHGHLFADLSCLDSNNFSQMKNLPERFNANATLSAIREELLDFASVGEIKTQCGTKLCYQEIQTRILKQTISRTTTNITRQSRHAKIVQFAAILFFINTSFMQMHTTLYLHAINIY